MRDITLKIRCSSDERDLFEQARKDAGFSSVAGWLRSFAYEYAKTGENKGNIRQGLTDVKTELQRIGNNLNQLTRSHNSGQSVDVSEELKEIRSTVLGLSDIITDIRPIPYIMEKKDHDR
ncbi:hypothetical protein A0U92_07300 [Acetobacter aceti]|uniref:Uncharacterized protein n=1 Tax=Acetobacter aceti TaxID=435 RepID=A0A1U9KFT8_ACEAC|nr:MobC family plasmid mobilization relaxosome protein [Acetobacter aceti]AQS84618.1 hypothetical protein A0U92_07300 [Acetobacter aceti]